MNLLYAIIGLQALDIISTYLCLTKGKGVEANPFLARVFHKIGLLPGLLLTKGAFIGLLIYVYPMVYVEALYAVAALYVWIAFNNFKILRG